MIIIDLNGTLISSLMSHINSNKNTEITEDLVRHMVLSTILSYKKKFGDEFGDLVLAADDKNYWRKDFFAYYKAGRKKAREDSGFDWKAIFNSLNKIRAELKEYFPYKVIQVEKTEADDIVATLCKYSQNNNLVKSGLISQPEKVLIISVDKDFLQLQKYSNVKQYSPIQKKFIETNTPYKYLKEHIIRGDSGDGIPNFLSKDSSFVDKVKQKSILTKKVEGWLEQDPEEFCNEEQLQNYKRNQLLIDLSCIPEEIENKIIEEFEKPINKTKSRLLTYFIANKLKHLMNNISDF